MTTELVNFPPLLLPPRDDETAPFWDAAAEGRLLLRRRPGTGEALAPALDRPSGALADAIEWFEATGFGQIHSLNIIEDDAVGQYVEALIDLDEGARMAANIVGPGAENAAAGERVRCVFEARGAGVNVPQFMRDDRPRQVG